MNLRSKWMLNCGVSVVLTSARFCPSWCVNLQAISHSSQCTQARPQRPRLDPYPHPPTIRSTHTVFNRTKSGIFPFYSTYISHNNGLRHVSGSVSLCERPRARKCECATVAGAPLSQTIRGLENDISDDCLCHLICAGVHCWHSKLIQVSG